jgi:hypothetical protein
MPLPGNVGTGTVTGTFTYDNGDPGWGKVYFTPEVERVRDPAADVVVVLREHAAALDVTGDITQVLVATDDTDLVPTGWKWRVREEIHGRPPRMYEISVPVGSSQDLADLVP